MAKYYLDTAIYLDYYFDRVDNLRPLGEWAFKLLSLIKANNEQLLISDFVIEELNSQLSKEDIAKLFEPYKAILVIVDYDEKQIQEMVKIARVRNVPKKDAIHAILARDNSAIFVARDNHFQQLRDICIAIKPEEII